MSCKRCNERVKDWDGDDPVCAFESGVFDSCNWNCATMNTLRGFAEESAVWVDDCNSALLPADGFAVMLTWYKRRGRTDGAWAVCLGRCEELTIAEAEEAIAYLESKEERR